MYDEREASIVLKCDETTLDMIQDMMGHMADEIRKALADMELDGEITYANSNGVFEYH